MQVIEHTYVSLLADVANLTGLREIRGSYEGLHWCLNEAPKLEKYMLNCVETGESPDPSMFPMWLQRLALGAFKDPIFMRYLRQLLLFCYKAEVQHDNETTQKALKGFLDTNSEVGHKANSFSSCSPVLLAKARKHCQSVLYRLREKEIIPSHGPGAVYESVKDKWRNWYMSIEYLYPYSDYMCLYFNRDHCSQLDGCNVPDHIRAKLIAVPKDSRGPRLICVHPSESIWIQQGLRRELERAISLYRTSYGPWPRGHVRFDDQSANGKISLLSSRTRRYATLDMKEASDRLSDVLVQMLFGSKYKFFGCCRAQKVVVSEPGIFHGSVHDIHSYAPMGNATTFPVQSLVFWAICCASMQYHGFHQPGAVFVFGDDIIVPSECAEVVCNDLESFGLVVNRSKSFWRGNFRESCGVDAFNGIDVTPVRWKTTVNAEGLVGLQSLSDMAMRLRIAGYEEAASAAYYSLRTRLLADHDLALPIVDNPNHGGLAEYSRFSSYAWRDAYWHRHLQSFVSPVIRLKTQDYGVPLRDWNHVLESLTSLRRTGRSSIPARDVSRRLRLDRGWIALDNQVFRKKDRISHKSSNAT
jgi:hypothetical protein